MSNPDFPGPTWQERSPNDGQPYRRAPDYGGRSAYDAGDGGSNGRGHRGSSSNGFQGYDARRGHVSGGNGYGRIGTGRDRDSNGYGRVGAGDDGLDDGYRDVYRRDGQGTGGRGEGRRAGLRARVGSRVRRQYPGGAFDADTRGPGGPGGPGFGGPDGPDGPDTLGPARRGARGFVRPDRQRPPGNWLERQWRARWWRRWTIKKAAAVVGGIAASMVLVLVAGFFYAYSVVQVPIQTLNAPLVQSSEVYFAGGKAPVGCFCTQMRTVLTAAQLAQDKWLEPAFFAAEDRRFETEGGISVTGTARAILVDLFGSGVQGGSTITEQLVKSALLPSGIGNLTYKEKLKEIIIAIKLAKMESKTWILTHYLNQINLGWGAYGVEAAAEHYFGKHAWQLSIAQCAMLASMVQYPAFDPTDPAQVVPYLGYSLGSRWVAVLGNMARPAPLTTGITQQQLNAILPVPNPTTHAQLLQDLKNFPKIIPPSKSTGSWNGWRGYIMADVMTELETTYGLSGRQIYGGGLRIVTTINQAKMKALYSAVSQAKKMMGGLPWYAHIGAVLENPKTGGIEAIYEGPNPNLSPQKCKRLYCTYPMATLARNQVGSSFKPYVLAAAVQENMNVKTSILNGYSPICVPPETMPMVQSKRGGPKNCPPQYLGVDYDPVVMGPTSVAKAAALSSNAAFEDLTHRVGTKPIITLAKSFGVDTSSAKSGGSGLQDDIGKIGIALGIAPLTVAEQATMFATLADNGIYHTPHMIASIMQSNGTPIPLKVFHHQVLNAAQVADVNWALSFDTIYGTGTGAALSPFRPTIAKTGTTNVAQSAFFIGALPQQYSFAVGMFTNSQNNVKGGQSLDILPGANGTGGGYGGAWPATIWHLFMTKVIAMDNPPVNQLAPLNLTGFQKWVQVKPTPNKKCGQQPPWNGNGNGNGNGHHHHGFLPGLLLGPKKCQGGGPGPSPSPSPSSTSPSPSPTSPSPSPSGSPSPSPPFSIPARPARVPAPQPKSLAPSLNSAAVLPRQPVWRPLWAPVPTGLR